MSSINFDNVYLLFLVIPLLAVFLTPFFLTVRKDNRNGHNIASMAMHVLMAVIIAFVLAGTSFVTVMTETRIYVLADVSYSARNRAEEVDEYISDLRKSLSRNYKLGVICFGKDCELLTEAGGSLKSVKEATVDKSETNIVGALEYAESLFDEGVIKRIVVISDGKQTDTRESNSVRKTVSRLQSDGVRVDAVYLDDNTGGENEMQITGVEVSSSVYLNHKEQAAVSVQSGGETQCFLTLLRNGKETVRKAERLSRGYNTFVFDLDTAQAGTFEYEVRLNPVKAEEDTISYNNAYFFSQTVSDAVKVLLVTENPADYEAAEKLYGAGAEIDAYVNKYNVPYTVEALCQYDEFILSDVDIGKIGNATSFIGSIDTLVSVYGKSLVTVGDMHIQNKTKEELAELEQIRDILPVQFGNNDADPKLYVLLIDVSHSMFMASRMLIAKQAAESLVGNMKDEDEVCIITFAGDSRMPLPPTALNTAESRKEVIDTVQGLTGYHGTVIGAGLTRTFNAIRSLDSSYSQKQVMLISDGMNYNPDENTENLAIVRNMSAYGIVTSVLDVGRGGRDVSEGAVAQAFLQDVSEVGEGEYYYVDREENVQQVVFGEMLNDMTESVVEKNSAVTVERPADGVMEGVGTVPNVSAYVYARKKGDADTVLSVQYQKAGGGKITVPLYAHRNYGSGKVSSFTGGGLSGGWISAWKDGTDETFFKNMFHRNMPEDKNDVPYQTEIRAMGSYTGIVVSPATYRRDAAARLRITLPNGEILTENMSYNSELSVYEFEFATSPTGKYKVELTYTYAGKDYVSDASFYRSYSTEYDGFALYTPTDLYKMLGGKGTVAENPGEMLNLENDPNEVGVYIFDLTAPLLIVCVVLFVADIVVRKLKWNDIRSLFGKVGK